MGRQDRLTFRNVTEKTDANLVAAARQGDAESFSRLCEQHYPVLVAIAYAQLTDRDMAEDAAQEALLAAYRGIARLKEPARFAAWLTSICRNIAIDMARARARRKHAESVDIGPAPRASRDKSDTVAVLRQIILRLEPKMKEVIYLRYYSRMGYTRIAQVLGISEETVNGRLRRARDKIRRQLPRRISTEINP